MTDTNEVPTNFHAGVDALAANLAEELSALKAERELLATEKVTITGRLKWLDGEIDKAQRMVKALTPRTRTPRLPDAADA